jgi:electron transport complex protein RnfB
MTTEAVSDIHIDRVDAVLPQTQCTRCGFPDCRSYARAIVIDGVGIGRCPPGGAEGVRRLAAVTGRPIVPLDPAHGTEGPRRMAVIDEAWCIGCTLCIKACPVDCIVGAPKAMHTVVETDCTGCDLCAPACPVDCITMVDRGDPRTGWAAWSTTQADTARAAYLARNARRARDAEERAAERESDARHSLAHLAETTHSPDAASLVRKRAVIEAALARARSARQRGSGGP